MMRLYHRRFPVRRLPVASILLVAAVLGSAGALAEEASPVEGPARLLARLTAEPLNEVSGLARSSYPGLYWVHNDSGDTARLFAIDLSGKPLIPTFLRDRYEKEAWPGLKVLNAFNVDWEDVTQADGTLYIAEMGNNGNARRDLGVYVLPEPNPAATSESRALRFMPVRYPEQTEYPARLWHFDCESIFYDRGKLFFLTKHRKPGKIADFEPGVALYRLDTHFTDRQNVLSRVGQRDDVRLATGADLSPDGRQLAVLTYTAVWLFDRPRFGSDWLSGRARTLTLNPRQTKLAEAITWRDDTHLLIGNENRELYEVDTAAFTDVR